MSQWVPSQLHYPPFLKIYYFIFVCVHIFADVHADQQRTIRSLGASVTGICEVPDMGT